MDEIITKSTSRVTAQASNITLRETATTRLIFRPTILENHKNPNACVKGSFLFQRKSKTTQWVDFETIPFSSLKSGEGYKLELKSAELLELINEIMPLYELYHEGGLPRGEKKFVRSTPQLDQLAAITASDVSRYLGANTTIGKTLLSKLLNWAVNLEEPTLLIEHLVELNPTSLGKLNAAVGLQSLKKALSDWESNINNSNEEFWQTKLTEHSFVLEQAFSWPTSIVKGKAYVGGKSVFNTGGNIIDFLMRNRLTQSAALIEIKTPSTPLLGAEYRNGIYNTSTELSGSIMQALNYKHSLQESFVSLTGGHSDLFDSFNPQCAVIIGNAKSELDHQSKIKSFELFRHQFPGLLVITFDELFNKTRQLIKLLESPVTDDTFDNDIPF
ncbi:MAG: Shedu immune nuclease family protein [Candidatus Sedimenticola sp. (ex Thyasira tokunagai)]